MEAYVKLHGNQISPRGSNTSFHYFHREGYNVSMETTSTNSYTTVALSTCPRGSLVVFVTPSHSPRASFRSADLNYKKISAKPRFSPVYGPCWVPVRVAVEVRFGVGVSVRLYLDRTRKWFLASKRQQPTPPPPNIRAATRYYCSNASSSTTLGELQGML